MFGWMASEKVLKCKNKLLSVNIQLNNQRFLVLSANKIIPRQLNQYTTYIHIDVIFKKLGKYFFLSSDKKKLFRNVFRGLRVVLQH